MSSINFIALITRDDKPLYIQSFDDKADTPESANRFLKYNFLSHMALDVFASPTSLSLREQQQNSEDGVLLLFIQDDVTVYGFETNNGLKIVVGLTAQEGPRLKHLIALVHKCYLRVICNPFTNVGGSELPPSFDRGVKALVDKWNEELSQMQAVERQT